MMIEVTSAYERTRVAIAHEMIGEVKDLRGTRCWSANTGNTLIIARKNRRVHWQVEELYEGVMARIRAAETLHQTTGPAETHDAG